MALYTEGMTQAQTRNAIKMFFKKSLYFPILHYKK